MENLKQLFEISEQNNIVVPTEDYVEAEVTLVSAIGTKPAIVSGESKAKLRVVLDFGGGKQYVYYIFLDAIFTKIKIGGKYLASFVIKETDGTTYVNLVSLVNLD